MGPAHAHGHIGHKTYAFVSSRAPNLHLCVKQSSTKPLHDMYARAHSAPLLRSVLSHRQGNLHLGKLDQARLQKDLRSQAAKTPA